MVVIKFITDSHGNHLSYVLEPLDRVGEPDYMRVDLYVNGVVERTHTYPYNRAMYEVLLELDEEIQDFL